MASGRTAGKTRSTRPSITTEDALFKLLASAPYIQRVMSDVDSAVKLFHYSRSITNFPRLCNSPKRRCKPPGLTSSVLIVFEINEKLRNFISTLSKQ